MRILIGCEYSGRVRDAFRKRGHEAWSCDILPTDTDGPHIQDDIRNHLGPCEANNYKFWDLLIAFPPCTHLAVSGARHFEQKRADGRQEEAIRLFLDLWTSEIEHKGLENPVNILSGDYIPTHFPELAKEYGIEFPLKPSQIVHPYFFGDAYMKSTCLWLEGLPKLYHTNVDTLFDQRTHVDPEFIEYNSKRTKSGKSRYSHFGKLGKGKGHERSVTPEGLAEAMAEQWNENILKILDPKQQT